MNISLEVIDWTEIKPGLEGAIRHMAKVELSRVHMTSKAREKTAIIARASALNDAADLIRDITVRTATAKVDGAEGSATEAA